MATNPDASVKSCPNLCKDCQNGNEKMENVLVVCGIFLMLLLKP